MENPSNINFMINQEALEGLCTPRTQKWKEDIWKFYETSMPPSEGTTAEVVEAVGLAFIQLIAQAGAPQEILLPLVKPMIDLIVRESAKRQNKPKQEVFDSLLVPMIKEPAASVVLN